MTMASEPSEWVQFSDEPLNAPSGGAVAVESPSGAVRPWRILIIDDDDDVHRATEFALEGVSLLGRPMVFLHAHSAAQARQVLLNEDDLALVLLDVVMETAHSGLELVDFIRNTALKKATRVVLRTGQPGYAPEHDTIVRYDINDYKTKSELTHHKLLTTVTTALRSYDQICTIDASREGLELIVHASGALMEATGLQAFATGVITQLAALLRVPPEGLVCALHEANSSQFRVLAAAGRYAPFANQSLDRLENPTLRQLLVDVLQTGRSHHGERETVLFLGQKNGLDMAAYVKADTPLREVDHRLLDVFCVNLSVCARNLALLNKLHADAYIDPLMQVPNRVRFMDDISSAQQAGRTDMAIALLDIDDFAAVNDLMGHAYGDQVLITLAQRLRDHLGAEVELARVSSNAFGLLGQRRQIAPERLQALLQEPLAIHGKPHRVSVTMGMADLDDSSLRGEDWLKNASIALKHAKRQSRGSFGYFSVHLASEARSRAQLLASLHAAFDADRLFLAFQPQVDLVSGELIGLEALMRWRTEDGRLIPPDQFIPVAEQSGLIVSLGDWVLQTACVVMRRLLVRGTAPQRMAVNVSVVQFQSAGFLERVVQALSVAGLQGSHLELEITESVAMLGSGVVEPLLRQLRAMGISVAIDDFGTGYSSLSYLEQLPLDRIKIDRAFVRQVEQSGGLRIAAMIAELGHKLGLRVLAEGIEHEASWAALRQMGVHEGQGFLIGRPMAEPELLQWLAAPPALPLAG